MSEKMTISELNIKFTADTEELKAGLKGVTSQLDDLKKQAAAMTAAGTFKNMFVGVSAAYVGKQFASVGKSAVDMAMDVVESESLFETSMGNMASKARNWSEEISDALGLNAYSVRNNVGVLYNMTTSMGIADSTAYDLSTTLTGLAYDMASFYNMDTDSAFYKIRAGITGETEPLKALGILVDENTVKQSAYKHGLAKTGEELTQQQKVIGRYLAILDQTSNAQGDMARTLDSPANKMRRLKEEWNQAAIALGQSLLPVIQKAVPYVSALARITTEAISGLSGLTGTTVELSSASGSLDTSNIKSSLLDISDEAQEAAKSLKGATLGIDELNILSSSTDLSDMDLSGTYSYDLSTSGYNLLGDLTSQTDEAYEKLQGWLQNIEPLAVSIGSALAVYGGYKVLTGIKNLGTGLKDLKNYFGNAAGEGGASGLTKALVGAGGVVLAAKSSYDMFYDLQEGSLDLNTALFDLAGTGGGIALAGLALGPTGALVAGAGALATGLVASWQASEDLKRDFINAQFFKERAETVQGLADSTEEAWKYMNDYSGKQEEYRKEISDTGGTIEKVKGNIDLLVKRSQTASDTEYPKIINILSGEFEKLCTAAEQSLTLNEDSVCGFFDMVIEKADTDTRVAIEGLKQDFIALQTLLGNEVATEEANIRTLLAKTKGGTVKLSTEDQKSLQESFDRVANLTATSSGTTETKLFEQKVSALDGVQFGSDVESAKRALQEYIEIFKAADKSIDIAYANADQQIDTFEIRYRDEKLRAAAKASGYDIDDMIGKMRASSVEGRQKDKERIQNEMKDVYKKLYTAYSKNVGEAAAAYAKKQMTGSNAAPWDLWLSDNISGYQQDLENKYLKEGQAIADEQYKEIQSLLFQLGSLAGYATGGMPQRAELFYAREDGIPELVGKIGSTTAVANNYQIEQGISDAVYKAMVSAKGVGGGNEQPLIIQIVDDSGNLKAEQYISAAERRNLRDGRITIPLGV